MACSDITKAGDVFYELKESLVYKDEEVLETGILKVQPLQFLDAEILRYRDQIQASVALAEHVHDEVPVQLLTQVEHVIQKATEGKTTLYKASALLEFTSNIFLYARCLSQDQFDLSHKHIKLLKQFDEVFGKMMSARVAEDMDQAQKFSDECVRCVESAVVEAELDFVAWEERVKKEDLEVSSWIMSLDEVKEAVKESIRDEVSELEMMKRNCGTDLLSIGSSLRSFSAVMAETSKKYQQQEADRKVRLEENRLEQEKLRRRLKELQEEENYLERQMIHGVAEEGEAKESLVEVRRQVDDWRVKIVDLQERVDTSLLIMEEMTSMTDLILNDAQDKQRRMKNKLRSCEMECLLGKRDSLMAHGSMCTLQESNCKDIIKAIQEELDGLYKCKQEAAKIAHTKKVQKAAESIKSNNVDKDKFEENSKVYCKKLEEIMRALHSVDQKIKLIKPSLHLDSLQERYLERKRLTDELFVDGGRVKEEMKFSSIRQYL